MSNNENIIEQLSDVQHVLLRPGTYIGATTLTRCSTFVLDPETEKFSYKEIEYVPGFLKIIYEILDNSVDEAIRTGYTKATNISIKIDESTNQITISDDGRGIPLKKMANSEMSMLEGALTCLRAGSNFNDDKGRILLGMNGVGSSLTNIFSKEFIAEVYDGEQYGILTCKNNLSEKSVQIKLCKSKKTGTIISFIPDLERFGLTKIGQIHINMIKQRLMFLSFTYPEIKFKYNNELIRFKNSKNLMSNFADTFVVVQDNNTPSKYMIGVIPNNSDEFNHKSYINGADCVLGGNHLDVINNELIGRLREKLSRKYPLIKTGDIKNRLSYIINFREFVNPMFNSQTKENFSSNTSEIKTFLKSVDWDSFAEKIYKCPEIIEPIVESFKIKEELQNRKTLEKIGNNSKKFKCKKFMPATEEQKYFAICEGDCLNKETEVFNMSENTVSKIKDLNVGDLVLTHKQNIKPIVSKSEKLVNCFKIHLKSGKEIECSADHRFFVYDTLSMSFKWKKLIKLNLKTDKLISNKLANNFVLDEIHIEKNDDKKYKLKVYGKTFSMVSSLNHWFLVYNLNTESFERVQAKKIDSKIHLMCLLKNK